jgi:hypothetical protein
VDHKGANWGATWAHPYWGLYHSLSYVGMARGFAYAGETAKARRAFQDFFELWKDAEPDIPILQQAKAGYAELRWENNLRISVVYSILTRSPVRVTSMSRSWNVSLNRVRGIAGQTIWSHTLNVVAIGYSRLDCHIHICSPSR